MMRVPAAYFDIVTTVSTSILTVLVLKKKTERYFPIAVGLITQYSLIWSIKAIEYLTIVDQRLECFSSYKLICCRAVINASQSGIK